MLSCTSMGNLQTNITFRQLCNLTEDTIVLCSLTGNLKSQLQKKTYSVSAVNKKLTKFHKLFLHQKKEYKQVCAAMTSQSIFWTRYH